jgi:hypothetical protein
MYLKVRNPTPVQSYEHSMPSTASPVSALPTLYYVLFGVIEPLITFASLLEGIFDPKQVCTSDKGANVN